MMNLKDVIFSVQPGAKLTPFKGAQVVTAIFLPLLVLGTLGQLSFGIMIGFGALFTAFCDLGNSVRARALAMGAATVVGALLAALGTALAGPWWLDIAMIFVITFIGGMLIAFGLETFIVALILTIAFTLFFLTLTGGPAAALLSAVLYLLGGTFLMLLTLTPALWHHPDSAVSQEQAPTTKTGPTLATFQALLPYALLRAIGAVVAALIGKALDLPVPYWAAYAVILCSWPLKDITYTISIQNIAGSAAAVVLADLIISSIPHPYVLPLFIALVIFTAFTAKDLSYTLFSFFMTIMTLLIISYVTSGQSFAKLRMFEILIGVGLAVLVTYLLELLARRQQATTSAKPLMPNEAVVSGTLDESGDEISR